MRRSFKILSIGFIIVLFLWCLNLSLEISTIRKEKKILHDELVETTRDKDSLVVKIYDIESSMDSLITDRIERFPWGSPLKDIAPQINSSFGWRKDPITKKNKFHSGIDLQANKWSKVYSTARGKVIDICDCTTGHGKYVLIDHGNGYTTKYSHLGKILVKVDEEVNRETIIGKAGKTGRATGPHLHYEIMKDLVSINPARYM